MKVLLNFTSVKVSNWPRGKLLESSKNALGNGWSQPEDNFNPKYVILIKLSISLLLFILKVLSQEAERRTLIGLWSLSLVTPHSPFPSSNPQFTFFLLLFSHGKAVVPWRTKPLQIADLAWQVNVVTFFLYNLW